MPRHAFSQITPHVWWLSPDGSTDRPTLGAVVGPRGTLLVDAGASPAHAAEMRQAMEGAGLPPVRYAVLTHWHWDHVFGTGEWDVPTFAHAETRRRLEWMAGLDWSDAALAARVASGEEIAFCRDMMLLEVPDRSGLRLRVPGIAFTGEVTVDLGGGVVCRLLHVGGDHAEDSVVVHVPGDGVAFLGDCYYQAIYGGPARYTAANLLPLLDTLLALDATHYLEGHGTGLTPRAELRAYADECRAIASALAELGPDRAAILSRLQTQNGGAVPPDDTAETVDLFLAGV